MNRFITLSVLLILAIVAQLALQNCSAQSSSGAPAVSIPVEAGAAIGSFYLRDGDTVVFYGDSITEQRLFPEYVAAYCVTRFPNANLRFINSGWGWDTVAGGPGGDVDTRLNRDVIAYRPSVVVISLGSNDAGQAPFDSARYARFLSGYRHILDRLAAKLPGVRLTLLSPPAYDDVTRAPDFAGGVNGVLARYAAGIRELAARRHAVYVDCNTPMAWFLRAAADKAPSVAGRIVPDRVHPGPSGHALIAAAILKAWNAPSLASGVTIDAMTGVSTGVGSVSSFDRTGDGLSFSLCDSALPWPIDRSYDRFPDVAFLFRTTRLQRDFNQDLIRITGLGPLTYRIFVDGVDCGLATGEQCGMGLDESLFAQPVKRQADEVLDEIRAADDTWFSIWRQFVIYRKSAFGSNPAALREEKALEDRESQIWADLRRLAQPVAHRYEFRRVK